jgi:hypothetical protein
LGLGAPPVVEGADLGQHCVKTTILQADFYFRGFHSHALILAHCQKKQNKLRAARLAGICISKPAPTPCSQYYLFEGLKL